MPNLKQYSDLPIRFAVGFHLIYGTIDNIICWDRMIEFKDFLEHFGFPFPLTSAVVSVYLQFISGLLFIVGWKVRVVGIVMMANFIIAILMVHLSDPYPTIYPAISMLASSIFLVLNGAEAISLDHHFEIKKATN